MADKVRKYEQMEADPFWAPWKSKKHPKSIEVVVIGIRDQPARGNFRPQKVLDAETLDDGECFTVACTGSLKAIETKFKIGASYKFTYLGEKKIHGQGQPMHDIKCEILVSESAMEEEEAE